ncbi:MAG: alpha/beta hydrolase [Gammaproteobacteria bacterium]|nr:alpha/beta hydrolase [Gammaproteobacteria bacterium]
MKDHSIPNTLQAWSRPSAYHLTIRGFASHDTSKPLLHFLHGNGMCGLTYWPMLSELQKDFDLLITDVQGHGDSDSGERFLGWNTNAEICAGVLRHHLSLTADSRRPVFGVAHSLGGALTTMMAADHPDLFDKLVLLDPVYFSRGMLGAMAALHYTGLLERLSPLARRAQKRRTDWPSRAAAANYLRERGIFQNWDEEALQCFVRYAMRENEEGRIQLKCPSWLEAKIFASYPQGLWRKIRSLNVPVHLLMAEQTFPFAARSAQTASSANSCFVTETVPGGHCFMQEYPQQSADRVRALLLS